ncbi:glutathione peroxidase [Flavisolibacter sp. BT320]|nr:glutathione peroxidase [Flavisolibacter longurius]
MKLLLFSVLLFGLLPKDFYALQISDLEGKAQKFKVYKGKKVLLVNIATGSDKVTQLIGLSQLQDQFKDSLVVIAFPSNSFGNEPRTNTQIKQFCETVYPVNFLLAEKGAVLGSDTQPVFNWLSKKSENSIGSAQIREDFQKFLIDGEGNLIGVFAGSVAPMDQKIISAIVNF